MATQESRDIIQKMYVGYYGRPGDEAGVEFWATQLETSNGDLSAIVDAFGTSAEYTALSDGKSSTELVNLIFNALFNRDAEGTADDAATGLGFYVGQLDSGAITAATVAQNVIDGVQGDDVTAVANKLDVANHFTGAVVSGNKTYGANEIDEGQAVINGVTADAATVDTGKADADSKIGAFSDATGDPGTPSDPGTPGSTFAFTTAADNFTGTADNDTFNGAIDGDTAANNTFSVLDTANGGEGTDTLAITADVSVGALAFPAANVSNIEMFEFRNVSSQDLTVNTGLFSGETKLVSDRSTSNVIFQNVVADTKVVVKGNGTAVNANTTATHAANVAAGTVEISNGVTAGDVAIDGADLASLTIDSTGAANIVGAISSSSAKVATTTINAATALTTSGLTIGSLAGTDQKLVVSGAAADVAATATTAAHSAVELGALDADFASVDASGLTAGGVSATLSATTAATFTGGAGNDILTTSTSSQTGAIDAGAGTDTLVLGATAHINTTTEGALYKGFEVLSVNNAAAIDMDLMTGSTIGAVTVNDGAGATAVTDMNATQAGAVTVAAGAGAMTLGVKNATTVGTADTLNITVSDGDATSAEAAVTGDWTVAGVETVNITATDDITLAAMNNITGMSSLTVAGEGDVSMTTGTMAVESNLSVNFSGLTKAATFNAAAATGNALSFTGGSGVDTVTDNVIGGNVLSTGAGNDAITLTDKASGTATVVTGGAGADTTTTNMLGNVAQDAMKFVYGAGDSVSDSSTTGISANLTDIIANLDGTALSGTAGSSVEWDTEVAATAVTAGSTDVVLGTTTVTNGGDFFVNIDSAAVTHIYQDTDGDKIIEAGEFAVTLTGIQNSTLAAGEFSIATGDLLLATA